MNNKRKTQNEYINFFEGMAKNKLLEIQKIIKEIIPNSQEGISYNIPAFMIDGIWIMYFSGYKTHISLSFYPTEETYEKFAEELRGYKYSKSAIQFPLSQELPKKLIQDIVKYAIPFRLNTKSKK